MDKIYDFEERLVRFAGETIFYIATIEKGYASEYYANQVTRSTGSTALHFGEAEGASSAKDFRYKMAGVVKEAKESRMSFKIMHYAKYGNQGKLEWLLQEVEEIIAIAHTMIKNKINE